MGYDSKLFVVEKRAMYDEEYGKTFASVISVYNACVFPELRELFTQPTDCYIYADDGNTVLLEDKYGKALTEASVSAVVECLESLTGEAATYRRIPPLLAMLRAFKDVSKDWENLAVLHYGD